MRLLLAGRPLPTRTLLPPLRLRGPAQPGGRQAQQGATRGPRRQDLQRQQQQHGSAVMRGWCRTTCSTSSSTTMTGGRC